MSPVPRLSFHCGEEFHQLDLVDRQAIIGRNPHCEIFIDDASVSRSHARMIHGPTGWRIEDLGSHNGVVVNDRKVQHRQLHHGDRILLGRVEVLFEQVPDSEDPAGDARSKVQSSVDLGALSTSLGLPERKPPSTVRGMPPGTVKGGPGTGLDPTSEPWAIPLIGRAAEALISIDNLPGVLNAVLDLLFRHLPIDRACVFVLERDLPRKKFQMKRIRGGGDTTNFRISRSVAGMAMEQGRALLIPDCESHEVLAGRESIVDGRIRSLMCAPIYHGERVAGLIYVDAQDRSNAFGDPDLEALATLSILAAVAVEKTELTEDVRRERERRERLERYSAPSVVGRILEAMPGDAEDGMISEEREATILFMDIMGFTTLSEHSAPRDVIRLLNAVFERLTECIFEFEGTLDKFTGDGLMAVFGVPLPQDDHAVRAVRAGLELQRRLAAFNTERPDEPPLQMRVGINTGEVVAGDIGSPLRKDFTVIGDPVNVASRLENDVASSGQVIIGPKTFELVNELFRCDSLGEIQLRGREETTAAWSVAGVI